MRSRSHELDIAGPEILIRRDCEQASTQLLDELSSFLSTFQRDLYAVSNHISDLQGRSKSIEARLEARKVRAFPFLTAAGRVVVAKSRACPARKQN